MVLKLYCPECSLYLKKLAPLTNLIKCLLHSENIRESAPFVAHEEMGELLIR